MPTGAQEMGTDEHPEEGGGMRKVVHNGQMYEWAETVAAGRAATPRAVLIAEDGSVKVANLDEIKVPTGKPTKSPKPSAPPEPPKLPPTPKPASVTKKPRARRKSSN